MRSHILTITIETGRNVSTHDVLRAAQERLGVWAEEDPEIQRWAVNEAVTVDEEIGEIR